MRPEIIRNHVPLPVIRQVTAPNDFKPAMLRAARIHAFDNTDRTDGRDKDRPRKDVVDALGVGSVRGKRLAPVIEMVAPWIDEAASENVELHRFGTETPDSAAV